MVARTAAAALAALALVAGCDGGDDDDAATTARSSTTTASAPPRPGDGAAAEDAFRQFVAAAGRGDTDALWEGLSSGSRQRLGPTPAQFARSSAVSLRGGLRSFSAEALETVVAEGVTADWALVAARAEDAVFATPMLREQGRFRVDIGGAVTVEPQAPRPAGAVSFPEARARVDAASRPTEARIWLDGRSLPATVGQAGTVTAPLGGLDPGEHSVVVFVQTPEDAAATAWTFTVGG